MSDLISLPDMAQGDRPLVWLRGEVKTPPFSRKGRLEVGFLLRKVQDGENVGMPHSRPMPSIGPRCHELRVRDEGHHWRIFYRLDADAVLVLDVHHKKTQRIPKQVLEGCRIRAERYDRTTKEEAR
jgi:phage-related protein